MNNILKSCIILFSILISTSSFSMTNDSKEEKCPDLTCVRKNIDTLNVEIMKLLSLRMKYVYQAGDIKYANNKLTATDQKRANAVIEQVKTLSTEYNLPQEYVNKIFTIIVNHL